MASDTQKWLEAHKICPGVKAFGWALRKMGRMGSTAELDGKTETQLRKMMRPRIKAYSILAGFITYAPIMALCMFVSYKGWGAVAWAGAWMGAFGWIILARGALGKRKMAIPPEGEGLFPTPQALEVYDDIEKQDPVWLLDFLLIHISEPYIVAQNRILLAKIAGKKKRTGAGRDNIQGLEDNPRRAL